jgi:hypothetical protein
LGLKLVEARASASFTLDRSAAMYSGLGYCTCQVVVAGRAAGQQYSSSRQHAVQQQGSGLRAAAGTIRSRWVPTGQTAGTTTPRAAALRRGDGDSHARHAPPPAAAAAAHLARGQQLAHEVLLVLAGVGEVDLIKPHPRLGQPVRARVIPRRDDDHLVQASVCVCVCVCV